MFVNDEKKAAIAAWYETFRSKIPVATESTVVQTSFGKTHVLIAGPEAAPPLVFLHGALASSAHAHPELGALLQTRRVYALDVIGQSVMSEDRRISLDDNSYGRWVSEATSTLGLEQFDLYGVSWGGFVSLKTAQLIPDRIKHLVLLVPAGVVGNSAWAGLKEFGWPMLLFKISPTHEHLLRVFETQFTTVDEDWIEYFRVALHAYRLDIRVPPLAKDGEFSAISCPVLAFGAEHDLSFPGKALLERIKVLIPQAEVELLEGSRHCPPLTDEFRNRMAARIEPFLNK